MTLRPGSSVSSGSFRSGLFTKGAYCIVVTFGLSSGGEKTSILWVLCDPAAEESGSREVGNLSMDFTPV